MMRKVILYAIQQAFDSNAGAYVPGYFSEIIE